MALPRLKSSRSLVQFDLDLAWVLALIQAELLRVFLASTVISVEGVSTEGTWLSPGILAGAALLFSLVGWIGYGAGGHTKGRRGRQLALIAFGVLMVLGILWIVDGSRVAGIFLRFSLLAAVIRIHRDRTSRFGDLPAEETDIMGVARPYDHFAVSMAHGVSYVLIAVPLSVMLYLVMSDGGGPLFIGREGYLKWVIPGSVPVLMGMVVLGYRGDKALAWVRALRSGLLVVGIVSMICCQSILGLESGAVYLALWPVLFVLLTYWGGPRMTFHRGEDGAKPVSSALD